METIVSKLSNTGINFTQKTGNFVKLKKQAKVMSNSETSQLNLMLVGPLQSGKTMFIAGLLEHGLKVFYITTDLGGNGLMSVKNALINRNKPELMKNLVELTIDSYEEMQQFLENPVNFFSEFYTFGFDLLFWDGFANFQHYHIGDKVAGIIPERKGGVSEARESGLQFEQTDWGMVKNATLRSLDRFFRLHNKKDGTVWHKIITCHPKYIQKPIVGKTADFIEVSIPNISGAASVMMGAAFDLIILTKFEKRGKILEYKYAIGSDGLNCCKNRGFDLPEEMEADSYKLWQILVEQTGIKKGKKDSTLVEED